MVNEKLRVDESIVDKPKASWPRKVSIGAGPCTFSGAIGTPNVRQVAKVVWSWLAQLVLPAGPMNRKSFGWCSGCCTPLQCIDHRSVSATAENIFGAERSPKGRVVSRKTELCHLMPSSGRLSGWTGTILYALV